MSVPKKKLSNVIDTFVKLSLMDFPNAGNWNHSPQEVRDMIGLSGKLDPTSDNSWTEWINNLLNTGKYKQNQLKQIQKLLQNYLTAWEKSVVTEPAVNFDSFEELQQELEKAIAEFKEYQSQPKQEESEIGISQTEVQVEFNPRPQGSQVTIPDVGYADSLSKKDFDSNVWVRQSKEQGNRDRVLMIQFSSPMLYKGESLLDKYYEKLYSTRKGYEKPPDFWEIPQWVANTAYMVPNSDFYTVRNMDEVNKFLQTGDYGMALFSCMDVNKEHIKQLAQNSNVKIGMGGYVDMSYFKDNPNVKVYSDLKGLAEDLNVEYKQGYDFRHFKNTKVIPRLNLSDGCSHKCAFCTIPKAVEETPDEAIQAQVDSFKDLNASLVYINDKTFGQAKNYIKLPSIYKQLKSNNNDFDGFIVQTTATFTKRLGSEFLKNSGIKYLEIGVETYNDSILRKYRKPHNEKMIDEAVNVIRESGVGFVPNIIIGFPEETKETYLHTLDFLKRNQDIISHLNIYNLAVYEATDLNDMLESKIDTDRNENVLDKSFHSDKKLHDWFYNEIFKFAFSVLDREPYSGKPSKSKLGRLQNVKDALSWLVYA